MLPKKSGSKVIMTCTSCGATDDKAEHTVIREKTESKAKIEMIDPLKEQSLPLGDEICPKCGHNKSYYWFVQMRAADEAETKFNKCEKCGHIWREYL